MAEFVNADPRVDNPIFVPRALWDLEWLRNGGSRPMSGGTEPLVRVTDPHRAVLASSLVAGSGLGSEARHMPCFDLDFPVSDIQVIESASGNSHLYLNVPMTWDNVVILMDAMEKVGLLQAGYVKACKEQQMTRLRMPGVAKIPEAWASSKEN